MGLSVRNPDAFHGTLVAPTLWVAGQHDTLLDLEAPEPSSPAYPVA